MYDELFAQRLAKQKTISEQQKNAPIANSPAEIEE
jgi:hypothetical protein